MKKIILVLAVAVVTMVSNAQVRSNAQKKSEAQEKSEAQVKKISWGVRVGMNVPSVIDKSDADFKQFDKSIAGFNVGVIMDWSLTKSFYIQPGIYFTTKGAKFTRNDTYPASIPAPYSITIPIPTTTTGTVDLSYLQIPILASYRFNLGGDTKLHINAGPYFALAVDGQTKTKTVLGAIPSSSPIPPSVLPSLSSLLPFPIEKTLGSKDVPNDQKYKKFDGGLAFNVGASFSKIYVGLDYDLGLANIASVEDRNNYKNYKMKNQVFNISVGYTF